MAICQFDPKYSEVFPAGSVLGEITEVAAEQAGIPQGLPLIASGSDKACEVLGTGCINDETTQLELWQSCYIEYHLINILKRYLFIRISEATQYIRYWTMIRGIGW